MEEVYNFITEHWVDFSSIFGSTVAICSVLVKILPNCKGLKTVIKILDYFSIIFTKEDKNILEKHK